MMDLLKEIDRNGGKNISDDMFKSLLGQFVEENNRKGDMLIADGDEIAKGNFKKANRMIDRAHRM